MAVYSAIEETPMESRGLVLVAGLSGAGKTTLVYSAAAIPDMCPVLGISCDNSHGAVLSADFRRLLADENGVLPDLQMDILRFDSVSDLATIVENLRADKLKYKDGRPFKTIILDNLTILQQRHFAELNGNRVAGRKPEWPEYLQSQMYIVSLLIMLTTIPGKFVLATCGQAGEKPGVVPLYENDGITPIVDSQGHARFVERKVTDGVGYRLHLSDQVSRMVPGYFSITGRLYIGPKGVRVFDARPTPLFPIGKYAAGSIYSYRRGKDGQPERLDGVIRDATMIEIWDCLRESNKITE